MKLLKVDTLESARSKLLEMARNMPLATRCIPLQQTQGTTLAEDLVCTQPVPTFRRSTVDGYAVKARDTYGASESSPVFLNIIEDVPMGAAANSTICSGCCAYVPTGGMIPEGADAMVMLEHTELFDTDNIAVYSSVSSGSHVVNIGEDMQEHTLFLKAGTVIGSREIGVMAAAGTTSAHVFVPYSISIISTGDELVEITQNPHPGQVRDINTHVLKALSKTYGYELKDVSVLKDNEELIRSKLAENMKFCDIIVISGGSSQGKKDMTARLINEVASPGVFVHGIALKPGKPTILGYDQHSGTLFVGLPGHPVAAMVVFELLVGWLHKKLMHHPDKYTLTACMETNFASAPGKTTCLLVKLLPASNGLVARPILGKSGLITTMTQADGYVLVDLNKEGLKAGEEVQVHLF